MKRILILAAVLFVARGEPCWAKLGETVAQIGARYGKPMDATTALPMTSRKYRFQGFEITVNFLGNVAVSENMVPESPEKKLSDEVCFGLAVAMTGETNWTRQNALVPSVTFWDAGKEFHARRKDLGAQDEFAVYNEAYLDEVRKQEKVRDKALVAAFGADAAGRKGTNSKTELDRAKAKQAMDAKVLKFHQDLADKGDPYGQYEMGQRYLKGDGVPKDAILGRELLTKSAAQDYQAAKFALERLPKE